jgi:hypothetical protein
MEDAIHQREAISGATRSYHAGNITAEEMDRIKAKARRLLMRGRGQDSDGRDSN